MLGPNACRARSAFLAARSFITRANLRATDSFCTDPSGVRAEQPRQRSIDFNERPPPRGGIRRTNVRESTGFYGQSDQRATVDFSLVRLCCVQRLRGGI